MNALRISLLMCVIAAFSNIGSAQDRNPQGSRGPRPKPETTAWWDQPIVQDLGLSEEQNKRIRSTVAESRDRLIQLRSAADKAEAVLQRIMDDEKIDLKRGQEAIDQVVTTRGDMMRAVAQMSLKLRMILTSAQWQILQKRESQPPPPLPGEPQPHSAPSCNKQPRKLTGLFPLSNDIVVGLAMMVYAGAEKIGTNKNAMEVAHESMALPF